ncbi:hypothetical protein FRC00_014174, partial [Tulasnella sp. 408]
SRYWLNWLYNLSLHNHMDNVYHTQDYHDRYTFNQRCHGDFDQHGHYNEVNYQYNLGHS